MSLKIFHMVFISVSVLLSLFVGVWGIRQYAADGSGTALGMGLCFLALGGALVVYGVRAFAKLKEIA
jgi:hypothetical protein